MGNGEWGMEIKQAAVSDAGSNTILSMPYAPCPMPYAVYYDDRRDKSRHY
jgi:hypothetical protein